MALHSQRRRQGPAAYHAADHHLPGRPLTTTAPCYRHTEPSVPFRRCASLAMMDAYCGSGAVSEAAKAAGWDVSAPLGCAGLPPPLLALCCLDDAGARWCCTSAPALMPATQLDASHVPQLLWEARPQQAEFTLHRRQLLQTCAQHNHLAAAAAAVHTSNMRAELHPQPAHSTWPPSL